MPDGSVKYVHVMAHALDDESDASSLLGAVMDVTAAKQAEGRIRQIIDTIPAYAWSTLPDGSLISSINVSWNLQVDQTRNYWAGMAFHTSSR